MSEIRVISKTLSAEDEQVSKALETPLGVIGLFSTLECFGKNGLVLYNGVDRYGSRLAIVLGDIPEIDNQAAARLYNSGWSQRHIGLIAGKPQSAISIMIKNSTIKRTLTKGV